MEDVEQMSLGVEEVDSFALSSPALTLYGAGHEEGDVLRFGVAFSHSDIVAVGSGIFLIATTKLI